jgi:hypothetical protein
MARILFPLAAVVVIICGGYWLWQQYASHRLAQETSALHAARTSCLSILDRHMNASTSTDDTEFLSRDCIERGLLSVADINARR